MSISDKSRSSLMPMIMPPPGKKMLPTRAQATALEEALLGGLDPDKLNDLSEVLFALNAHKLGPIPGFYVVVCTRPDEEWWRRPARRRPRQAADHVRGPALR